MDPVKLTTNGWFYGYFNISAVSKSIRLVVIVRNVRMF